MNVFIYSLNGVLPVFIVILISIFLNKQGFFSENTKDDLTKLVFYAGTPVLLFNNISSSDFFAAFHLRFVLFVVISIVVSVFIMIGLCFFIKDKLKKAAVVQIAFRSNFAIIGIPLANSLLDKEGVASLSVLLSFVVITYNVLAVIMMSYYTGKDRDLKTVVVSVIKNPLIIGSFCGLVFAYFKIPVPVVLRSAFEILGSTATSVGLLILGATITFKGFLNEKFYILYSVFLRNILSPLLFISAAVLLGFRGNELMITAILSAAPAAINCFVMAKKMGADATISAFGVSFTSLFSVVSIFASVFLIKLLGYA